MSDWQPGDLAVFVRGQKGSYGYVAGAARMRKGGVYTVERVVFVAGTCGLVIAGHHSNHPSRAWHHRGFIRVTPPKADEFDRETIRLLKGAPVNA